MSKHFPSLISVGKLRLHILVFFSGLFLRTIPELIVPWYPVGYETITYYAPSMFRFSEQNWIDVFVEFFRSGPVLYVLLWFGHVLSWIHPFIILKIVGPLLYGCLAVSFLVFLKRGLNMNHQMAFVGALLLVFQVATLRIAWDRFRNMLALSFVFAALTVLKIDYRYKWWFMGVFAMLTVLSRDYIVWVLFVTVFGFAVLSRKDRVVSVIALAPALTVFSAMFFSRQLWMEFIQESRYTLNNYLFVVQDAFAIFVTCYLILMPFVVKGFRRDKLLDAWFVWLVLGSFSVIIPWLIMPGYQRWLMLLVFPLSIYAIKGFERFRLFEKSNLRKLVAVVLIFMVVGFGYSGGFFSYVGALSNSWVPVNLVQSSITWEHVDNVKGALRWLNENAMPNSSVLTEERFYGWTLIYLGRANEDIRVIIYGANSLPQPALKEALDEGFRWIYLIWYTESTLEDFQVVYSLDSISIFQFKL